MRSLNISEQNFSTLFLDPFLTAGKLLSITASGNVNVAKTVSIVLSSNPVNNSIDFVFNSDVHLTYSPPKIGCHKLVS